MSFPTFVDGIGPPLEQIAKDYTEPLDVDMEGLDEDVARDVLHLIHEIYRLRSLIVSLGGNPDGTLP